MDGDRYCYLINSLVGLAQNGWLVCGAFFRFRKEQELGFLSYDWSCEGKARLTKLSVGT
jgi:hypothetical protein